VLPDAPTVILPPVPAACPLPPRHRTRKAVAVWAWANVLATLGLWSWALVLAARALWGAG
jgi:hypothetical protein